MHLIDISFLHIIRKNRYDLAPISRSNEWSLNTIYAYISHTNTKKDAKNDILFCDPFGVITNTDYQTLIKKRYEFGTIIIRD